MFFPWQPLAHPFAVMPPPTMEPWSHLVTADTLLNKDMAGAMHRLWATGGTYVLAEWEPVIIYYWLFLCLYDKTSWLRETLV